MKPNAKFLELEFDTFWLNRFCFLCFNIVGGGPVNFDLSWLLGANPLLDPGICKKFIRWVDLSERLEFLRANLEEFKNLPRAAEDVFRDTRDQLKQMVELAKVELSEALDVERLFQRGSVELSNVRENLVQEFLIAEALLNGDALLWGLITKRAHPNGVSDDSRRKSLDELETKLFAAEEELSQLEDEKNRYTPEGFDSWVGYYFGLRFFNARSVELVDSAGRADPKVAKTVRALGIKCSCVQGALYLPDSKDRLDELKKFMSGNSVGQPPGAGARSQVACPPWQ